MDGGRLWHEELAGAGPSQAPKRQKTFHHDPGNAVYEPGYGLPTLQHDDYTIAWICALPIEGAVARAMLDDIHAPLPTQANDSNTYTLGSISQHNVVIACLPEYGTNNAANVLVHLIRTFTSIRFSFMVGIGGGAPSKADIRLGDIVVGNRVMQHDLGKLVGDGQIQTTAIPKTPNPSLRKVVSTLRSKHELEPSQVPSILQQKLARYPEYNRPNSQDRLFQATYNHDPETPSCDGCDQSKLVSRSRRKSDDPIIHYGAIASGNQVVRHGTTRDDLAQRLDVLCFEMEAAGVMGELPCLTIRGICDYSDTHKDKQWQRYAAATAAAYTKEFIETLPATEAQPKILYIPNPQEQNVSPNHRQRFLDSLRFLQMDARKSTIKSAHAKTCRWFLCHPDYKAWLDPTRLTKHHGLLWISGKPGAGKSTMMKFAYLNMRSAMRNTSDTLAITASFFFNARGDHLEKSVLGMYQSLLLQLLEGFPDLQAVLDDPELLSQNQNECSLNVLKDIFHSAVSALGQRSFTCFVDALDECDEQQVMDMVEYFEELVEDTVEKGILLRICFSSRHYPYIDIRRGVRLTLEDQAAHAADLSNYVQSRLRIKDPALIDELRPQILEKAAGVFLWVVLVVDILNKENRRGRLALRKRLAEVPSGLSELFRDILRRDSQDMDALLLCILWILYAKRPLSPTEYYHALWSGLYLGGRVDSKVPDVTDPDAGDRIFSYVISSSKGLAEITKAKQPTVQFMHESVKDFLIKDNGLHELWPDLAFDWCSPSHERLKECCNSYMNHPLVHGSISKLPPGAKSKEQTELSKEYPFLEYAARYILHHANAAADAVPQDEFLSGFLVLGWIKTINFFEAKAREYSPTASLFYIFAERGFPELIRTMIKKDPCTYIFGERYKYPLFAALVNGNTDAAAALLHLSSNIYNGVDIMDGLKLKYRKDFTAYKNLTPLSWAAENDRKSIVRLLLLQKEPAVEGPESLSRALQKGHEAAARLLIEQGADINASDKEGQAPFSIALKHGHEGIARLLIEQGADINASTEGGRTYLSYALETGNVRAIRFLIKENADVNATNRDGSTPLSWASRNGYEEIVRLLIEEHADVNAASHDGSTPLLWASRNSHEEIVRLLIEEHADVNAAGHDGSTPLLWASRNSHEEIVRLLIEEHADVNAAGHDGSTPLLWASRNSHEEIVRLLIEKGADINFEEPLQGHTALLWASRNDCWAVARLLIQRGADINVRAKMNGFTPILWASNNSSVELARFLIENGADVHASSPLDGFTPLLYAARNGCEEIARLVIAKGADINAGDHFGLVPLLFASKGGHHAVVNLLIEKGAVMPPAGPNT